MKELDKRFHFTQSGNIEKVRNWLVLAINSGYKPAMPRMDEVLMDVGRIRVIRPLYEALVKTTEGKKHAQEIYAKARPRYHPILQGIVDGIVK
jgi:leukotriene-A4 hydrolase